MQFKNSSKQRNVQGLRSFKDTLPKNIKKIINKKGHIYSETLNNWKYIVGEDLFKYCYPKSFKNSNRFGVSTLIIMVKRGHEIDLEYSKKDIMDKMNNFFGYAVVEKIKLTTFTDENNHLSKVESKEKYVTKSNEKYVTNMKYKKKIENVKNEKIKKSLIELTKAFIKK